MATRSTFELTIKGEDPPPESNTYLDKVTTSKVVKKSLLQGAGTDQMTVLFKQDSDDAGTIGTSATAAIDLQTALDPFGEAMALTDVCLLYIEHKAGSAASSISVQASAANGFTNLMAATANLTLSAGDFMLVAAFTADNLVVSGSNKSIDIINDDGAQVASYTVEVWGRIG